MLFAKSGGGLHNAPLQPVMILATAVEKLDFRRPLNYEFYRIRNIANLKIEYPDINLLKGAQSSTLENNVDDNT